ncbi:hypothetical protein V6N13_111540 [Hibiscus sabdariffa]
MLLGVSCLSRIPPLFHIEVNGEKSFSKVSCSAFEDEHCWIDGWKTNGVQRNYLSDEHDSLGSSRVGKEPVETPETLGRESKLLANFNCCGLRGTTLSRTSSEGSGPRGVGEQLDQDYADDMLGKSTRFDKEQDLGLSNSSDRPSRNQLVEVQVEGGADSYTSSGHIVSIEPVLDPVSGLFSVKPRGVEASEVMPEALMGKAVGGEPSQKGDKITDEAKASLEICENLGLIFNEERKVILKRGLGRLEKKAAVKKVISRYKANVLFIQESKLKVVNSRIIGQLSGPNNRFNFYFVALEGSARGLISLWDPDAFKCESCLGSKRFIILHDKNFFLASVSSLWNQYWVKVWLSLLVYSGAIQMLGSLMVSEPKRGVVCVS